MKKLSNTEAEMKKSVGFLRKACKSNNQAEDFCLESIDGNKKTINI